MVYSLTFCLQIKSSHVYSTISCQFHARRKHLLNKHKMPRPCGSDRHHSTIMERQWRPSALVRRSYVGQWTKVLGRGRPQSSSVVDVDTFNKFFFDKVAKVRAATADAKPPTFTAVRTGLSMRACRRLSVEDVTRSIGQLPDKTSAADPLPTPTSI